MNQLLLRQVKDIQHQAGKLLKGDPDSDTMENFARYNEEMKSYLMKNLHDPEIRKEVERIPNIQDVQIDPVIASFFLTVSLAIVTLGVSVFVIAYLTNARLTRMMQHRVHECQGKYANIEFLIRSL